MWITYRNKWINEGEEEKIGGYLVLGVEVAVEELVLEELLLVVEK
jgi:hypothetical protein